MHIQKDPAEAPMSPRSLFFSTNEYETEPTSGLEPLTCSLRVIKRARQRLAEGCKTRIPQGLSLLRFAPCCTILRSQWCQRGIDISRVSA